MPSPPAELYLVPDRRTLSGSQRIGVIAAILAAHGLLAWGLLQISAVRETIVAAAPMMFSMVSPEKKPLAPPPPRPVPKVVAPAPVINTTAAEPTSAFVVVEPESETPPSPVSVTTESEPAPSPPAPKIIPASAIQYRVPPPLEYPRASRRLREAGRTIIRVYVDESGTPHVAQIRTSSGFARLDEAALTAVQKARFKPYTENGVPTAGWALIPLDFELEM